MFGGFKTVSANFTPTPNQFFDEVLGHYPCRVVTVVGILIRSTLGWQDADTGERRIEAELPLSSFIRPDLCENSARRGLAEAITAGLIVRTVSANSREGARYALRWSDGAALERALEKSRRMQGSELTAKPATARGPKNAPLIREGRGELFRGPKNAPPYIDKKTKTLNPEKKEKKQEQTLNVGEPVNFVATKQPEQQEMPPDAAEPSRRYPEPKLRHVFEEAQEAEATKIVEELRDWGSERRHKQLLAICERHGLFHLPAQALQAVRQRLASESKRGVLEKPGAYYQSVLISLLEGHQVFVPKSSEEAAEDVRLLARASLGLE